MVVLRIPWLTTDVRASTALPELVLTLTLVLVMLFLTLEIDVLTQITATAMLATVDVIIANTTAAVLGGGDVRCRRGREVRTRRVGGGGC